ncbi:phosphatidate cytidylyltransferase [Mesoplasma lactucae]|uniref:Phosphatidate cytidylyltransferase n=1 Tax=Mesoplasma lactucae ATCC 49193 TaxID=81460 RepID=A0A291IRT5_9MOLU|nr:phosphatidate cytidylyltransferase [Mesoplasma lactucae]ATG97470.1 hypothetical protein CP520_01705 [Mesoplasma lactucae ATCC 49193]ATZ20075.1 phosphatidate cytidylyltransferase [Mesoplasma lactucae ATCC 49193]MCL8216823.1 hypothetical protein [Mesoplasma lactucae ATCC 49193]
MKKQTQEHVSFKQKYESSDLVKRIVSSVFLLIFLGIYVGLSIVYTEGSRATDYEPKIKHAAIAGYFNFAITIILVGACAYELIKAQGFQKNQWEYFVVGIIMAMVLFILPFEKQNTWAFTNDINLLDWYRWYIVFLVVLLGIVIFWGIPYLNKKSFKDSWKQSLMLIVYMFVMIIGFKGFNMISLTLFRVGDPTVSPWFGFNSIIWIWGTIILTDTFAYLGGRKVGKTPLAPSISPKKTVEGSAIGSGVAIAVGVIYSVLFAYLLPDYSPFVKPMRDVMARGHAIPGVVLALLTLLISLAGQVGDLFFSWYKRAFNVKDFSKLIPGHGGILDRLDSFLFVFFIFYFIALSTL